MVFDAQDGDLNHTGAQLEARYNLRLNSRQRIINDDGSLSGQRIVLGAHDVSNQKGSITQSGDADMVIAPTGILNNREGRIASNSRNMTLSAGEIDNQQGSIIHTGQGAFSVSGDAVKGDDSKMLSAGNLLIDGRDLQLNNATTSAQHIRLEADALAHRGGQMVQTGSGVMSLMVQGSVDNRGGSLAGNGDIMLRAAAMDNRGGQVIAAQSGNLNAILDNRSGQLISASDLDLEAGLINNSAGGLVSASQGRAGLVTGSEFTNHKGRIEAGHDISLLSSGLDNQEGELVGREIALSLDHAALNNQQGTIAATDKLNIDSGALNNDSGLLQSGSDMRLNTDGMALSNHDSGEHNGIISLGALSFDIGALDNTLGVIMAEKGATLNMQEVINRNGTITGNQDWQIHSGTFNNSEGVLKIAGNLVMNSKGNAVINQQGKLSSGGTLSLNSGVLNNQDGLLTGAGELLLDTQGQTVDNRHGELTSGGAIQLTSGNVDNREGQLQSLNDLAINAPNSVIDNTLGVIRANTTATLLAQRIINRQTGHNDTGIEGQNVTLTAATLDNQQGRIAAGENLTLNSNSSLDNSRGLLSALKRLSVQGGSALKLTNRVGQIIAGEALALEAGSLSGDGSVLSDGDLSLTLR